MGLTKKETVGWVDRTG